MYKSKISERDMTTLHSLLDCTTPRSECIVPHTVLAPLVQWWDQQATVRKRLADMNDAGDGADAIRSERLRQIRNEGYTREHDRVSNIPNDLVYAAMAYCLAAVGASESARAQWPWSKANFKPKNPRRDLERAGALLAAALDRMVDPRTVANGSSDRSSD